MEEKAAAHRLQRLLCTEAAAAHPFYNLGGGDGVAPSGDVASGADPVDYAASIILSHSVNPEGTVGVEMR